MVMFLQMITHVSHGTFIFVFSFFCGSGGSDGLHSSFFFVNSKTVTITAINTAAPTVTTTTTHRFFMIPRIKKNIN